MANETSADRIGGAIGRAFPAAPAEAESGGEETVVNYYFPVEVEAVGALDEDERAALLEEIYRSFTEALERLA